MIWGYWSSNWQQNQMAAIFQNFCPSLRHFMLKEIWQVIKGNLMTLIKKHLLTERNLGILILKLATKQNGRHFHNCYPSFRHFVIKVIWQVIKGNLMVLISKNLFTGLEFGILILKLTTKTNKQTNKTKQNNGRHFHHFWPITRLS